MEEAQAKLQALSGDFQSIQKDLEAALASRQKLDAQKQENKGVEKEFGLMKDGEKIFKIVGPVLMAQDKAEAEATVKGRLEYIDKELSRVEKQIEEAQAQLEKKKTEIIQIQASVQSVGKGGPGTAGKGKAVAKG